jgi:hypothetical protein
MMKRDETIATIKKILNVPLLGVLPFQEQENVDFDELAQMLLGMS